MQNVRLALLRAVILAVLFAAASVAVVVGVAMLSPAAGWIVGGILAAAWATVVFGDIR